MPSFCPPLYHTSEVLTDDHTSTPFARLTFSVQLDDGHVDGVYQLWTDLPNLKADGTPLYSPGEWHEISFTALAPAPATEDSSSAAVTLTPRSVPSESSSPLYAIFHIPSSPASYSYTLRQVKGSGEVVWLGSDGSNGTVVVKQGETSTEVVIEAGTWDGTLKQMEEIKWGGVAVVVDLHDRHSYPSIVQLPTSEPIKASLVVAVGIKPTDTIPFFQLSLDAASPGNITRNIAMAVAGCTKKRLDIPSTTVLPSKSRQGTFGRSESGSLPSAIQKALAEQSEPAFDIVESGKSHVVLSPARTELYDKADLVLLAYSPLPQTVSVAVPAQIESTSPILCQIAASRTLLQAKASPSPIPVKLGAGLVADVFRFTEMSELRIAGGADSIWICAPDAQSVEVGEEEFGEVSNGDIELVAPISETSEVASSAAPPSEAGTELPSRSVGIPENESEYEAGDEDDSVVSSKPTSPEQATSWFFRMLDSLLVRIWSWIFSPFQAQPVKRVTAGEDAEVEVDTEGETAVESPAVDERTPLLTTPGLSRSTSSTFNSPLNSPESSFTIKAKQSLQSLADGIAAETEENDDHTIKPKSALGLTNGGNGYGQKNPAGTVSVRSYTQFSFASPPPFTFYLPSESGAWQDKVKFSAKTQMDVDWAAVGVDVRGEEGGAVEVVVGEVKEGGEGAGWQVQVERL